MFAALTVILCFAGVRAGLAAAARTREFGCHIAMCAL